jgi:flagellar biosynthesis/type III secretory pathway protein FliH
MDAGPRILKGNGPPPARRIDAAVFDADRRGREMVAAAEEQARVVIEGARAERARVLAEAREEGRREGEARAAALLVRAAGERDRLLGEAPREIARLALTVARKVLGRAVAEPEGLLAIAEAAVAAARGRSEVVVRVSPADGGALRAGQGRLVDALGRSPVEVREDPALARGVVVVVTDGGRIEAGIEAQLEVLALALEEALG